METPQLRPVRRRSSDLKRVRAFSETVSLLWVKVNPRKQHSSAFTPRLLSVLTLTLSFRARNRLILAITRSPARLDFTRRVRSSAYLANRCPLLSNSLSRSSKRIFLGGGESGPPCGTPLDVSFSLPFTTTPARRYRPIRRRMPLSLTRRETRLIRTS